MRQARNDESRKDFIVARQRGCQRRRLVVSEKHDSDQQKQRELKQNDEAAEDERLLAVALIAACEQPLHEQLIRTMRSHGQASSAEHACPESERHTEVPRER